MRKQIIPRSRQSPTTLNVVELNSRRLSAFLSPKGFRSASSPSHPAVPRLRPEAKDSNSKYGLPRGNIKQKPTVPYYLQPQIYDPISGWTQPKYGSLRGLQRGSLLKVVSWNLNVFNPDAAARALAALRELQKLFGEEPRQLVVMLQELNPDSLRAILEDS